MKHLALSICLILMSLLISCNTKKSEYKNIDQTETTSNEKKQLLEYSDRLQGKWKRQSYPFGSIEFKGKQVKFSTGEGNIQPSTFKNYNLSHNCSSTNHNLSNDQYDFGLNTGNDNCDGVKLNGNSLTIHFAGSNDGVAYKKVGGKTDENNQAFDDFSGRVLPLEPGFYVLANSDCENPANAAWRYWNGIGISGSSTKACKMKLIEREGNEFVVTQTCTNTYDKSKSRTDFTVIVEDVNHFSLVENGIIQKFEFCKNKPSWLKM